MIDTLDLNGLPAFGPSPAPFGQLGRINFVFGPNGSGKTSISRKFDALKVAPEAASWVDSDRLSVWVFNRDYVAKTFQEDQDLPGVFVLGEGRAEAMIERERLASQRKDLHEQIISLQNQLGPEAQDKKSRAGKRGELSNVRETLADAAWAAKDKLLPTFKEMFAKYNASRSTFVAEVLRVREELSDSRDQGDGDREIGELEVDELPGLVSRLDVLQQHAGQEASLSPLPPELERGSGPVSELMSKPVLGRKDAPVAALIERLNNSDWVAEGQSHLDHTEGVCPFCQQELPEGFADQLAEYFDRGFEEDIAAIRAFAGEVEEFLVQLESVVADLVRLDSTLCEISSQSDLVRDCGALVRQMRAGLARKLESPAAVVELPASRDVVARLVAEHVGAQSAIEARRELLANKALALEELRADVWAFLIQDRLSGELDLYDVAREPLERAIAGMEASEERKSLELLEIDERLRELAREAVSSEPVLDQINEMLGAVGFTSFRLNPSDQLDDGYQLVRDTGEVVGHTLSEGERSFISFLYFAHELEGVPPEGGRSENAVVVIDDPISSLDSEALFFVSTYLRNLLKRVVDGTTAVKQVLVLTHNVFFHKELTYKASKLCGGARHLRYFEIVKRGSNGSIVVAHDTNPVSTVYDGLWRQVRRARAGEDVPGLQNAMRRIVESYFQFVGDPLLGDLPASFEGVDRLICKALISWAHDGSHASSFLDAIDYAPTGSSNEQWLNVFERLFEIASHRQHFEAMTDQAD
ncbi:AAA family ATPase [Aeromicrobium alkaliterrae]|uniref:Nuclease SbcCD subunit C n=1 Tax=Aeromicrobium alkaliterrae TaxID=302168 RepID=A0ABP4WJD4_9ACTN